MVVVDISNKNFNELMDVYNQAKERSTNTNTAWS